MSTLYEKILRTIQAHHMFCAGDRVAVAVSGGPDSLALLHLLQRLAPKFSLRLQVAHFNHRLRGAESDGDEQFVREVAERVGLAFFRESAGVRDIAKSKRRNEEATARECRYRFFKQLLDSRRTDKVALGHTANDQAETFLMRLMRGAGTRGLAGIHPVMDGQFVRPLLDATRGEIEQFLRQENLVWREDASNADVERTRNRIRHKLLPELMKNYNPEIVRQLAHTAGQCRQDDAALTRMATAFSNQWSQSIQTQPAVAGQTASAEFHDAVALPLDKVATLDPALRSRLLRLAFERVNGNLLRIEECHVSAVERLLDSGQSGDVIDLPQRLRVERVFEQVYFYRQPADGSDFASYECELSVPGEIVLPHHGLVWRSRLLEGAVWRHEKRKRTAAKTEKDAQGLRGSVQAALDFAKISLRLGSSDSVTLKVRSLQPGDHYRPQGSSPPRRVKVADLLSQRHIAVSSRKQWPLLVAGSEVVWVRGCEESQEVAATAESATILVIDEVQERGEQH